MSWVVIHEPEDDPFDNRADREFPLRADAEVYRNELDRSCLKCDHTVAWVD